MKARSYICFSIVAFVIACVALALSIRVWSDGRATLTVNKLHSPLSFATLILAANLWVLAIVSTRRRTLPRALTLWCLPVLLVPANLVSIVRNIPPYIISSGVEDSEGHQYAFIKSAFLQGTSKEIGRLKSSGWFIDVYDVVAEGGEDSVLIVRPENSPDDVSQLYLAEGRWLVGVSGESWMGLVYDLQTRKTYADEELRAISPFILIGSDVAMSQDDIERMLTGSTGFIEKGDVRWPYGLPAKEKLMEELRNPRADIRALARELLDAKRVTPNLPD